LDTGGISLQELDGEYPQDAQSPSTVSVAYFYVKEDNQRLHDLGNILKSIAFQIANADPVFKKHVLATHKPGDAMISSRAVWNNLLLEFFGSGDSYLDHEAFVIIDGLDEAPPETRKDLLNFLRALVETPSGELRPRLQFAILGRHSLREDSRFVWRENYIEVSSQKNRDDIDKYIMENLKKVTLLHRMNQTRPRAAKKFAKEIRASILQGSDGMFLWAKLILAQIYEKERKSEIRETLRSAPRELDKMIEKVFLRLENDPDVNLRDLNMILAWVTCARRPLLLGELDEILRIPSGEQNLALKDRLLGKLASIFTLSRLQGAVADLAEPEQASSPDPLVARDGQPTFLDFDPQDADVSASSDTDHTDSDDESDASSDESEHIAWDVLLEFSTTQVVFGHKRIKDYLVEAKFTFDPIKPNAIGVDMRKAGVDITVTLLSVLCNEIPGKSHGRFSLIWYASGNFMKHLESIDVDDISRIPDTDKARILKLLYRLFHDEDCIKMLLTVVGDDDVDVETFIKTWFATDRYTELVRQWFREAEELEDEAWDQSMREWMTKAGSSAKELLRPIALSASATWLAATPDDIWYLDRIPNLEIWILHGYCAMVSVLFQSPRFNFYLFQDDEGASAINLNDYSMSPGDLRRIEERKLNEMAEFGNMPKTEHWHTGVARALLVAGHFTAAMKHFEAALDINSNMWMSVFGLGKCLGALDRFEEALPWLDKVIKSVPQDCESQAVYALGFVAEYKENLKDLDGAIAAREEQLRLDPSSITLAYDHIWMLHRLQRYDAILNSIRDFDGRDATNFAPSLLVELISKGRDIGEPVGNAATVVGGIAGSEIREVMRKAVDDAVAVADKDAVDLWYSVRVRLCGGNFYSRHLNDVDKAIEYWETALQLIDDHSGQLANDFIYERNRCTLTLSEEFFRKAVEATKNGGDPGPWVSKLQKVSSQFMLTGNQDDPWLAVIGGKGHPSQLYGIWLREHENAEERVWRAYFRASILEGLELLNDDDPVNDQHGYASLAGTLLRAGDKDNGLAALSITLKNLELRQAKDQDSEKAPAQNSDIERRDSESPSLTTPEDDPPCKPFISNLKCSCIHSAQRTYWIQILREKNLILSTKATCHLPQSLHKRSSRSSMRHTGAAMAPA
jgi:tetratricopeptide (TPR) repeat protein